MSRIAHLDDDKLTRSLAYAGYVLLAFELIKSLVVEPVKQFYAHTTFGAGMPFKSYAEDVAFRHKNEFEACLLYLRDFMQAIDSADFQAVQDLRKHRNDLAHKLPAVLPTLNIEDNLMMLEAAHKALFKLSNHEAYIQIGCDPAMEGSDWNTLKGPEYLILEAIIAKAKLLRLQLPGPLDINASAT
jgi:hypothetical protein